MLLFKIMLSFYVKKKIVQIWGYDIFLLFYDSSFLFLSKQWGKKNPSRESVKAYCHCINAWSVLISFYSQIFGPQGLSYCVSV